MACNVQAKACTYLRSNSNDKDKSPGLKPIIFACAYPTAEAVGLTKEGTSNSKNRQKEQATTTARAKR